MKPDQDVIVDRIRLAVRKYRRKGRCKCQHDFTCDDCSENFQDCYLKVGENLTKAPTEDDAFAGWVYQVAENHILDQRRWESRRATVRLDEAGDVAAPACGPVEPAVYELPGLRKEFLEVLHVLNLCKVRGRDSDELSGCLKRFESEASQRFFAIQGSNQLRLLEGDDAKFFEAAKHAEDVTSATIQSGLSRRKAEAARKRISGFLLSLLKPALEALD